MSPTFDYIASYYDRLAFIVYGNNLKNAKLEFLHLIPEGARILIMGGGTGNILNKLLSSRPAATIDFIDTSGKMLHEAESNLHPEFKQQVNFIQGDHLAVPSKSEYDVVTTFFVLDCLKQEEAIQFSKTAADHLKKDGIWLFADFFHTKNIFQQFLLWFMYRFFKITTGISAGRLPDYDAIFYSTSLKEKATRKFLKGFIVSKVYAKEEQ